MNERKHWPPSIAFLVICLSMLAFFAISMAIAKHLKAKPQPVNYLVCYQYVDDKGGSGFGNAAINITGKWDANTLTQTTEHIRTNVLKVNQQVVIISLTKVE